MKKFKRNALIQAYKGIFRVLIVVILLLLKVQNIIVYIIAISFLPWVLFLFNSKELGQEFVDKPKKISKEIKKEIWNYSSWLGLWSVIAIIGSRVDQIVIVNRLGLNDIAIYNVAMQLMFFYLILSSSLSTIIIPMINSALNKGDMIRIMKKTFMTIFPMAIGLIIITIPSSILIPFLYGDKYIGAQIVYIILSFGMIVSLLSFPMSLAVQYFKKTYLTALGSCLQLILTVVLNIIFIPKFNITGAAFAFLLTNSFMCIYYFGVGIVLIKRAK